MYHKFTYSNLFRATVFFAYYSFVLRINQVPYELVIKNLTIPILGVTIKFYNYFFFYGFGVKTNLCLITYFRLQKILIRRISLTIGDLSV